MILFTLIKKNNGTYSVHYLIVQRRDTIEYVDCLRPKCPISQMEKWITLMTPDERQRIVQYIDNFPTLWHDLTLKKNSERDEIYLRAKKRFEENKDKILTFINNSSSEVLDLPWGFPKGRKNSGETPQNCAIREFEEETSLKKGPIRLFINDFVREEFKGSDGKDYATNYFIYETFCRLPIRYKKSGSFIPSREMTISNEINDMKWVTLEEAKTLLNSRRFELLKNLEQYILEKKS